MSKINEDKQSIGVRNRRVHMANERTFLAWIRTSIGVMTFGFVVERFSLFIKQMSYVLGKSDVAFTLPPSHGYSSIAGIYLVGLGALMSVLSFIRYKKVERQILEDSYHPASSLNFLLTLTVLAIGIFLVFYLIQST